MINWQKYNVPIRRVTEEENLKEFENRKKLLAFKKAEKKRVMTNLLGIILPLSALFILFISVMGNNEANAYTVKKEPLTNVLLHSNTKTFTGTFKAVETKLSWQAVTVHGAQLEEMKARKYDNTRILDLLMAKSMECHQYDWNCIWFLRDKKWRIIEPRKIIDYWPFQINRIHTKQFNESLVYKSNKDWWGLFKYQLNYANKLIQSYEDRYCGQHIFEEIGRTYTNERRAKCVYSSYNWSKNKDYYAKIAWEKRKIISDYLFTNNYLTN